MVSARGGEWLVAQTVNPNGGGKDGAVWGGSKDGIGMGSYRHEATNGSWHKRSTQTAVARMVAVWGGGKDSIGKGSYAMKPRKQFDLFVSALILLPCHLSFFMAIILR